MDKNKKYKPHKITKSVSLGAMMENMGDHIKILAENYTDLNKKFGKIDKIKQTQEYHSEMIAGIAVNLETVKSDVEIVKSDVGLIKNSIKRKVDVEEFEALEKRVSETEPRFFKH